MDVRGTIININIVISNNIRLWVGGTGYGVQGTQEEENRVATARKKESCSLNYLKIILLFWYNY